MANVCVLIGCGRPVEDAAVCQTCTTGLAGQLAEGPALDAGLLVVLARLTRYGDRDRRPSSVRPLPYDTRAASLRADAVSTLAGWSLEIWATGELVPPQGISPMAGWIADRIGRLRQHRDAAAAFDEIGDLVGRMRWLVDRPPDRQFVGICSAEFGDLPIPCPEHLYAKPDSPEVHCPTCGSTYLVVERLGVLRGAVRDVLARPVEICRAVGWVGEQVRDDQISRWFRTGRLTIRGHEWNGARIHPLYRIGDVLDLLVEETARRRA